MNFSGVNLYMKYTYAQGIKTNKQKQATERCENLGCVILPYVTLWGQSRLADPQTLWLVRIGGLLGGKLSEPWNCIWVSVQLQRRNKNTVMCLFGKNRGRSYHKKCPLTPNGYTGKWHKALFLPCPGRLGKPGSCSSPLAGALSRSQAGATLLCALFTRIPHGAGGLLFIARGIVTLHVCWHWRVMSLLCGSSQKTLLCTASGCRGHCSVVLRDLGAAAGGTGRAFLHTPASTWSLLPRRPGEGSPFQPQRLAQNHLTPPDAGPLAGFLFPYQASSLSVSSFWGFHGIMQKSKVSLPSYPKKGCFYLYSGHKVFMQVLASHSSNIQEAQQTEMIPVPGSPESICPSLGSHHLFFFFL